MWWWDERKKHENVYINICEPISIWEHYCLLYENVSVTTYYTNTINLKNIKPILTC